MAKNRTKKETKLMFKNNNFEDGSLLRTRITKLIVYRTLRGAVASRLVLSPLDRAVLVGTLPTKIYINESLTAYRRRLFGKLNSFKNINKWKYLWTTNGTIHLRQTDSSQTFHFNTMEDFEEFVNPQKDK